MEWQPIETAPKDGASILGWNGSGFAAVKYSVYASSTMREEQGYWALCETGAYADFDDWDPTHWMPLPPPPSA